MYPPDQYVINSLLYTEWKILQSLLMESHMVCNCVSKLGILYPNQCRDSSNQSSNLIDVIVPTAPQSFIYQTSVQRHVLLFVAVELEIRLKCASVWFHLSIILASIPLQLFIMLGFICYLFTHRTQTSWVLPFYMLGPRVQQYSLWCRVNFLYAHSTSTHSAVLWGHKAESATCKSVREK